jgi:hypothetical protein
MMKPSPGVFATSAGHSRIRNGQSDRGCRVSRPARSGIERDLHFEARGPISAYVRPATEAKRIVETIDAQEDMKGGAP